MSGICDTCQRNQVCRKPMEGMDSCRLYISGKESNYEKMFGTPERAAGFLLATIRMMGTEKACSLFDMCDNCSLYDMNIAPKCWKDPTGEAVLEWLESEGGDG